MATKVVFFLISLLSLAGALQLHAQEETNSYEFRTVFGSHGLQDQGHLFQDKIYGADFIYNRSLLHDKSGWVKHANAKSYGIALVYRDFTRLRGAQDTITNGLGSSIGLVARLKIQLFQIGKIKFNFIPGLGLSYATKPYFKNKQNLFVSSHLNETILGEGEAEIPLSPSFTLGVGGSYLHHSNGAVVVPNGGLNTASVYLGIKYNTPTKPKNTVQNSFQTLQQNSFELIAGVGIRGVFKEKRAKFRSGFYGGYNLYLNDLFTLKGGVDAVYYYTTYDPNIGDTYQNYGSSYKPWRAGMSVGTDMNFWRITINAHIGKYLYFDRLFKNTTWYWGFGTTYFFTPRLGLQAATHMHFAQADFVNYGIVVKI